MFLFREFILHFSIKYKQGCGHSGSEYGCYRAHSPTVFEGLLTETKLKMEERAQENEKELKTGILVIKIYRIFVTITQAFL